MRYTQGQIRELLGISVDAFRTWREVIPALASHKGHAPSFMPGDMVAMAIVAELVRDFGIRVGTIGDRLDQLFAACQSKSWLILENCVVMFEANTIRLVDAGAPYRPSPNGASICVPCAPIVARLRSALTAPEVEHHQGNLLFPPTALSGAKARAAAS